MTTAPSAPAPQNLADIVRAAARAAATLPALIGAGGTRTWAELDAAIDRGAAELSGRHAPGDRVVLALPTGADLAAALFAVVRAGLVAVPVDPERTDVAWVVRRVDAVAAVTDAPIEASAVVGSETIATWWSGPGVDAAVTGARGEDLALLARASREGPPVMLSHRALLGAAAALGGAPQLEIRPDDRVLQVLPLYHVVGLVTAFLPAALAGAAVVVPEAREGSTPAESALAAVRAHRVSVLPAEPTLYRQLDRVPGFERALATVRLMTSGSSPLDPADFAAVRAATGQAVWEGYGISESAAAVTSTLMTRSARPGSVGLPYPGVQVRIALGDGDEAVPAPEAVGGSKAEPAGGDAERAARSGDRATGGEQGADAGTAGEAGDDAVDGQHDGDGSAGDEAPGGDGPGPGHGLAGTDTSGLVLSDDGDDADALPTEGEVGPIEIRGSTLFSGYWPDGHDGPAPDGWYLTGDIGYFDDAGELHLVDRAAETVTVAGFTVYPREVEDVLVTHPYVADAAVVGVPGRSGPTVVAALVAQPGTRPTPDDLDEFLADKLAPFKVPTGYQVVAALPRTEVGRLDRDAVRRGYAASRGISLDAPPRLRSAGGSAAGVGPEADRPASGAATGPTSPADPSAAPQQEQPEQSAEQTAPEEAAGLDELGTKLPSTQSRTRRSAQDSDDDLF